MTPPGSTYYRFEHEFVTLEDVGKQGRGEDFYLFKLHKSDLL